MQVIESDCLVTSTSFSKQSASCKVLDICELSALSSDSEKMTSVITLVAVPTTSTAGKNMLGRITDKRSKSL